MSENVLTRNQKRSVAALLENRTVSGAAAAVGLNEKTLRRYLEIPDFRRVLARAEMDAIDEAGRRLIAGQPEALDTLHDLMTDAESENVRRLATVAWLDFTLRWRELKNIEERLTSLEVAVYGKTG